ncbi:MAG TPA: hypothetical protein VH496_11000 [Mycobacterium sp.]|jgi:dienelactone hydrolase
MTAAATRQASAPSKILAILISDVLGAVINLFVGPAVLPPGSNVTLGRSTLQVGDITVRADWYFPKSQEPPTGVIYFQHGAFAATSLYSYTAAALAERTNSIVVLPTMSAGVRRDGYWLGGAELQMATADLFGGDRAALTASASAAARHPVTLPQNFVLVGHSNGGAFVTAVAGDLFEKGTTDGLKGVVLFDPSATAGQEDQISESLTHIPDALPVLMMGSPPYFWNEYGDGADALVAARPGEFVGVILDHGTHVDYMQGARGLVRLVTYLVAGFARPENVEAVKVMASGWITDMLKPSHDGIYATPGQTIQIDTAAGTATAAALGEPAPSVALTA